MSNQDWNVTFRVFRKKENEEPYFENFQMEVKPGEYVLEIIERIWAFKDRSLTFAHACHHSTCGACGMRVNGKEKLTCITLIKDVVKDGGIVKVEPMRNFPIIGDLAVDMGKLYLGMDSVGHNPVVSVVEEPYHEGIAPKKGSENDYIRLSDCIECGLCISACPVATTNSMYLGPAVLAGALQASLHPENGVETLVDCADGVWRCHSAFECTEVCPSYVEPGKKIMQLRRKVVGSRIKSLFSSNN
ncbi:MAG: succinate dehydrogenase/fumarate reductase iron-sulfur subunit [Anaerolineales bacterium]